MARYEARTDVTGSVWKIVTTIGQELAPGDAIMIVESMKMEIPVVAEDGGKVVGFLVEEGKSVAEGDAVAVLET